MIDENQASIEATREFESILTGQISAALENDRYKVANAKKVLNEFCTTVRNQFNSKGEPYKKPPNGSTDINIDPRLAWYLLGCFEKILDQNTPIDPKEALNLKEPFDNGKKVKQADPDRKKREIQVSNEVAYLCDHGIELDNAITHVAAKYYSDKSVIDTYPLSLLAGRYYPAHGDSDGKGFKAVKNAYYEYRIESQALKISKSIRRYLRHKNSI